VRHQILKEAMPLSGVIADVGSGKGHMSLALASAGYNIDSIDISAEEQEFARLNLTYYGVIERVKFHIADAKKLFYKDSSVDCIFCVCVLHHVKDYLKVIEEFFRVTKPKGKIVLSDFSTEGLKVIGRMHESEGRHHETFIDGLLVIEDYLNKQGKAYKKLEQDYQDTLIITA
jgi:ubiquinone/menaquinone biosynthesis C-methylase UbiE